MHYIHSYSDLVKHIPPCSLLLCISNHLFFTIGKGIFVVIQKGVPTIYIFNNQYMLNDWAYQVPFHTHEQVLGYISPVLENQQCQPILQGCSRNNYLVRCEFPFRLNTNRDTVYATFIEQLVHTYFRDMESGYLFINRKDFPVMPLCTLQPFDNLQSDNDIPLCSLVKSSQYVDGWIPNEEEIRWLSSPLPSNTSFDSKVDKLFFRGSATGYGITAYDNTRLRVCSHYPFQDDPFYDIGLISKRVRIRLQTNKTSHHMNVVRFQPNRVFIKDKVTLDEMASYRYVLCLSGHVYPFRLLSMMSHGCVVLWCNTGHYVGVQPKLVPWFYTLMKPYVHYIPLDDHPDKVIQSITSAVQWIHTHPTQVRGISKAGCELATHIHTQWHTYLLDQLRPRLTFKPTLPTTYLGRRLKYVYEPNPCNSHASHGDLRQRHGTPLVSYLKQYTSSTFGLMQTIVQGVIDIRNALSGGWYVYNGITDLSITDDGRIHILHTTGHVRLEYSNDDVLIIYHSYDVYQVYNDISRLGYPSILRSILLPMCELILHEYQQCARISTEWFTYVHSLARIVPILFGGFTYPTNQRGLDRSRKEECTGWLIEWCSRFIIDGRYRLIYDLTQPVVQQSSLSDHIYHIASTIDTWIFMKHGQYVHESVYDMV